ncbi:MAG: DKNYY domain-containing protein [Saprospiraceae bacterium]
MKKLLLFFLGFSSIIFSGCGTGYQKEDGNWVYVSLDGGSWEKQSHLIEDVDKASFHILWNKDMAKDKNHVYHRWSKMKYADAGSFENIKGEIYSKDKNSVFINHLRIENSDPISFEILEFPYSKDKNQVYCGNVPMRVNNIASFKALEKGIGSTQGSSKSFDRIHPEYAYLDSLLEDGRVFYSIRAYAEAEGQFFEDFREIERPDPFNLTK